MGTWGKNLYENDTARDVADYYKDQLRRGVEGETITKNLIDEFVDVLSEPDDAAAFWFALADTQWNFGRLEFKVKECALKLLRSTREYKAKGGGCSDQIAYGIDVLDDLERKLSSPQPAKKKVSQYRFFRCPWQIGDVYAYPLDSDCAKEHGLSGEYFLFHKIAEDMWWPGHTVPIVRVKITKNGVLPKDKNEFEELEYVQTAAVKSNDLLLQLEIQKHNWPTAELRKHTDQFGYLPEFQLLLVSTSLKSIPKKLFYIGNFQDVTPPKIEFIPFNPVNIYSIAWKFLDQNLIERYCGYNLRQFSFYSSSEGDPNN